MWNNYIGQQIRRCNRNLLITNLLLLGALAAYAWWNGRYLTNFLSGSTDISNSELAELRDPNERGKFFVRVNGDKSFDTGIQSVEQTVDKYTQEVRSTTVKAEYRILRIGGKLLVVKTDPSSSGTVFKGALETMPASVYQQIVTAAIRDEPRLQGMFIPAMLNASDYREEGWWTIGIGIPLLLFAGWNLWKWRKRVSDYTCHPIYRRIACFGTPEQVAEQIEAAIRTNTSQKISRVRFFGPWLFKSSFFGLTYFHIPDLIWVYQKVTKHSTNFIPTGKSFAVVLNDRHGYSSEIQLSKKNVEPLMAHILEVSPWIVAGFSNELKSLWTSRITAFIAAVDERRKESTKATTGGQA
jgi:hypothetical protein